MPQLYLDNAATTQVSPKTLEAMLPYFTQHYANPSSIHQPGQTAHLGLNQARNTLAHILGCTNEELTFTSCATESINTILRGVAQAYTHKGKHIITSKFEHSATLATCQDLEKKGYQVTYLTPNKEGFITLTQVQEAARQDTILVSLIYVQNEIGTIQPIEEIGKWLQEKDIFFHTDAVQAFQYLPCSVDTLHVDALSLSAHKFHGPKGVGLLYLRKGHELPPLLTGGNQEFGMRSGTQNVPGIVGMATAAEEAHLHQATHKTHVEDLRTYALQQLETYLPHSTLNGSKTHSAPHIINLSFPSVDGETLLIRLDLEGIALSTGAACSSEKKEPSHTLLALGKTPDEAQSSIRISLTHTNTKEEIDYLIEKLTYHVGQIQHYSQFY